VKQTKLAEQRLSDFESVAEDSDKHRKSSEHLFSELQKQKQVSEKLRKAAESSDDTELKKLTDRLKRRDETIANMKKDLQSKDEEIANLKKDETVANLKKEIKKNEETIAASEKMTQLKAEQVMKLQAELGEMRKKFLEDPAEMISSQGDLKISTPNFEAAAEYYDEE